MKTIGIIGGMGPAATLDLYDKIIKNTKAAKDQDHIHVIIDSYAQIEDRTGYILNGGPNPLNKLVESAKRLEGAGADVLIMACNTAHYFYDDIKKHISIPFIHISDAVEYTLKNEYKDIKKLILIATKGTLSDKKILKYDEKGFDVLPLNDELQNNVMDCIYKGVKAGKTEEYVELFQQCVTEMEALKPDAIIGSCTEIPILAPYVKFNVPIIDATLELAKAAIRFAKG